jgi:hypothetical protein
MLGLVFMAKTPEEMLCFEKGLAQFHGRMPVLSERHFDASQTHGLDKVETSGRIFMGDWNVRFRSS